MIRSFALPLTLDADGRTVFGRIFPFGSIAHIRERNAITGDIDEYDEEFLPGCTERMRQVAMSRGGAPAWIKFTLDHEVGFDHRVGYCTTMAEAEGGVDCSFKLYADARLDKVRSMLGESHTGLSIEFDDLAPPIIEGTLQRRRQINIGAVTATPIPVYAEARVLALRSDEDPVTNAGTPKLDAVRAMLAAMDSSDPAAVAVEP